MSNVSNQLRTNGRVQRGRLGVAIGEVSKEVAESLGMAKPQGTEQNTAEYRLYKEASPVTYITPDDPPFLLMHGDKDEQVAFSQSEEMETKLKAREASGIRINAMTVRIAMLHILITRRFGISAQ